MDRSFDTALVILYKCHLFGVSPPVLAGGGNVAAAALASIGAGSSELNQMGLLAAAEWRSAAFGLNKPHHEANTSAATGISSDVGAANRPRTHSDCSLCNNIDRHFECVWCADQCQHNDQCLKPADANCPPPQIRSVSLPALLCPFVPLSMPLGPPPALQLQCIERETGCSVCRRVCCAERLHKAP